MRLKRSELKEIHIKKRIVEKDSEGGRYETFSDAGTAKAIEQKNKVSQNLLPARHR